MSEFWSIYNRAKRRQEINSEMCVRMLRRGYGVAAVHPDDGWVDRRRDRFDLVYPLYKGHVAVGALVALGHHTTDEQVIGKFRIVEVTDIGRPGLLSGEPDYGFREVVPDFEITAPEVVA